MDAILNFISEFKFPVCAMTIFAIFLLIKKKWALAFNALTLLFAFPTFAFMFEELDMYSNHEFNYLTGIFITGPLTVLFFLSAGAANLAAEEKRKKRVKGPLKKEQMNATLKKKEL